MSQSRFRPLAAPVLGLLSAVAWMAAWSQTPSAPRAKATSQSAANVIAPRDWMQVREGFDFTVPTGFVFVPTALGIDGVGGSSGYSSILSFDGVDQAWFNSAVGNPASMKALAPGLAAFGGTVVSANASATSQTGQAWGYLMPDNGLPATNSIAPAPADRLVVVEGAPYTVPAGKVLAFSAVGSNSQYEGFVIVDNEVVATTAPVYGWGTYTSPVQVPNGLTAKAGSKVEVVSSIGGATARAWAFLADE